MFKIWFKKQQNGLNLTKIVENLTGIFGIFHRRQIFGLSTYIKNIPENSDSNILRKEVYFPENVRDFENLTGTHSLSF